MPLTDQEKNDIEWCPCGHVWEAHFAVDGCCCSDCTCRPTRDEVICLKHKCPCINIDERLNIINLIIDVREEQLREQIAQDIWASRRYYENPAIISRNMAAKVARGLA